MNNQIPSVSVLFSVKSTVLRKRNKGDRILFVVNIRNKSFATSAVHM